MLQFDFNGKFIEGGTVDSLHTRTEWAGARGRWNTTAEYLDDGIEGQRAIMVYLDTVASYVQSLFFVMSAPVGSIQPVHEPAISITTADAKTLASFTPSYRPRTPSESARSMVMGRLWRTSASRQQWVHERQQWVFVRLPWVFEAIGIPAGGHVFPTSRSQAAHYGPISDAIESWLQEYDATRRHALQEQQPAAASAAPAAASAEPGERGNGRVNNGEADIIYTHATNGAKLYLGGVSPGTDKYYLTSINCKFIISIMDELVGKDGLDEIIQDLHGGNLEMHEKETSTVVPSNPWIFMELGKKALHYFIHSRETPHLHMVQWIIPVGDAGDAILRPYFKMTSEIIDNILKGRGENIIVHCSSGASRSSTIVIAYLMIKLDKTLKQAYREVYSHRPMILPGINFFKELMDLDNELNEERWKRWHRIGDHPELPDNRMSLKDYYAYTVKKSIREIHYLDLPYKLCLSVIERTGYDTDEKIQQAIDKIYGAYTVQKSIRDIYNINLPPPLELCLEVINETGYDTTEKIQQAIDMFK